MSPCRSSGNGGDQVIKISEEDKALASRLIGGPAGLCGSVLTINSAEGTDLPAGPSAITRIVYLVAGFNSSIRAAYGKGGPVNSCCCHIPAITSYLINIKLIIIVIPLVFSLLIKILFL